VRDTSGRLLDCLWIGHKRGPEQPQRTSLSRETHKQIRPNEVTARSLQTAKEIAALRFAEAFLLDVVFVALRPTIEFLLALDSFR
jgi:hypothetical protein